MTYGLDREFKVTLKLGNKPDLYQLQQFLRRKKHELPQEAIQALDVALRASPSEKPFFSTTLGPKGELCESCYLYAQTYFQFESVLIIRTLNIRFALEDGSSKTLVQYYRERYNVVLKNVAMPAIQSGSAFKPLCTIVSGQRYSRKLNERQVTALLRATCQRPGDRERVYIRSTPMSSLQWMLKYHDSGREKFANPSMGQWNMTNKKLVNGGRVDFWGFVNFSRLDQNFNYRFCEDLVNTCISKGVHFNVEPLVPFQSAHHGQMESVLRDIHRTSIKRLEEIGQKGRHLQLLIVILPDVGGRNTILNDAVQERNPFFTGDATIIFGADVTHPPPGEDSSLSIAAVSYVFCFDFIRKDNKNTVVHGGMIRDGVSEGQFSQVLLHEVDAIRRACASLEKGCMPPVTFVVVQKRHHTRLFPTDRKADKSGNILPGTVVDTTICHPTEFDFISTVMLEFRYCLYGTSRPAHYHVLFDENRFTADALQVLTNNLCYTYARCTRSVSIVPPAYYAHLLAYRAQHYIEGDYSDGGPSTGPKAGVAGGVRFRALPEIKQNVKNVMFYC
ncbi:hypothetical protein DVH24_005795 [Malus domestica]|uniref:Piwi domain-containing protein n=1 Tax=Malus domestica TaxID=3750 RepID=A0A498INK6_MALDO|nr:hypothetical protein DVH24_005795 [Malus domestica]